MGQMTHMILSLSKCSISDGCRLEALFMPHWHTKTRDFWIYGISGAVGDVGLKGKGL